MPNFTAQKRISTLGDTWCSKAQWATTHTGPMQPMCHSAYVPHSPQTPCRPCVMQPTFPMQPTHPMCSWSSRCITVQPCMGHTPHASLATQAPHAPMAQYLQALHRGHYILDCSKLKPWAKRFGQRIPACSTSHPASERKLSRR